MNYIACMDLAPSKFKGFHLAYGFREVDTRRFHYHRGIATTMAAEMPSLPFLYFNCLAYAPSLP